MGLLRSLFSKPAPARPRASTGDRLVYAVGDVHGRRDLLDILLESIVADCRATTVEGRPLLVLLGDYIDRGPQSAAVLDAVIALKADARFEVRALKGNHEQQMLLFLDDAQAGLAWANFGGRETLISYGVKPPPPQAPLERWEEAQAALVELLPPAHFDLLQSLELTVECGDYIFVHAGLRPGVAIADNSEDDLLKIREEFLSARTPFEKTVVHGHTPQSEPVLGQIRVGVDTGAYATGRLTAVRLLGDDQQIIQASAGA